MDRLSQIMRWRHCALPPLVLLPVMLAALLALALLVSSCAQPTTRMPAPRHGPPATQQPGPSLAQLRHEPQIRVRIANHVPQVTLDAAGQIYVGPTTAASPGDMHAFASPLTVRWQQGAFLLTDGRGQSMRWAQPVLLLVTADGSPLIADNNRYPPRMTLHPRTDNQGRPTNHLDMVNHVPMEHYLPGVVEREVYTSWPAATLRAQAIAARSYALFEQHRNRTRHYDIESTVASQVYGGLATNQRVIDAVRATRGAVVVWQGHVLPTFYSSCTGGVGQDAVHAMNNIPDMPPLRGREQGNWGQGSRYFRWSANRQVGELTQRITAWGRANNHAVAQMQGLTEVRISSRNSVGRPTGFSLIDGRGQSFQLRPEDFRRAANHPVSGLPELDANAILRSSHVTVRLEGTAVRISGQGFGHGVGMCQWGAQGMAAAGHDETAILRFYYPGTTISRAY